MCLQLFCQLKLNHINYAGDGRKTELHAIFYFLITSYVLDVFCYTELKLLSQIFIELTVLYLNSIFSVIRFRRF